jgi:DNA processing protein
MAGRESYLERNAMVLALATACRSKSHLIVPLLETWPEDTALEERWAVAARETPEHLPNLTASIADALDPKAISEMSDLIEGEAENGTALVTVLDSTYPRNLRGVPDRPPFLWVKGSVTAASLEQSVAIVGTRKATSVGLDLARTWAQEISATGTAVFSGLAAGVDSAAHEGALNGSGVTIAVMGTGTRTIYPAKNAALAQTIIEAGGALVSQFMPGDTPRRWTFPMRNAVMSGLTQATLVIEASETSGAKLQARIALKQGKALLLSTRLVDTEAWARKYVDQRGAIAVASSDEALRALRGLQTPPDQLSLC